MTATDHKVAVSAFMDWIERRIGRDALTAVGHRVVHGGPKYSDPTLITAEIVEELRQLKPFDPEHLPEEIELTEAFHRRFPTCPKWPVSTPLFTMICHAWPSCCRSRAATRRRACGGTDFMGYRMRFWWANWLG